MKNKDLIALLSTEDPEEAVVFRTATGEEHQIGSVEWAPPYLAKGDVWEDGGMPIVKIVEHPFEV